MNKNCVLFIGLLLQLIPACGYQTDSVLGLQAELYNGPMVTLASESERILVFEAKVKDIQLEDGPLSQMVLGGTDYVRLRNGIQAKRCNRDGGSYYDVRNGTVLLSKSSRGDTWIKVTLVSGPNWHEE